MNVEKDIPQNVRIWLNVVLYNILFMNDIAMSYVYDVYNLLSGLPMFKGKIKYRTKILMMKMREYNALINCAIKSDLMNFLADLNEKMTDHLQLDFMKLENAVRNHLTKDKVPNADLITKVSIAYTLCESSIANIKYRLDEMPQEVKYYGKTFRHYNLNDVFDALKQLHNLIDAENSKIRHYTADLRNDSDIGNGFTIIINKLKDMNFIYKIIGETEKEYKSK